MIGFLLSLDFKTHSNIGNRLCIFTGVLLINIVIAQVSAGISDSYVDKELILTQGEKNAFDKFKRAVYSSITLEFMKQDLFLLRWIRSKNLNVDISVRDMFQFMEFCRKNKIDTILKEDWSDISQDHPFYTDAIDRQGRPVAYTSAGIGWNIRRTVLEGKRERLTRYMYKIVFEMMMKLAEINKKNPNVTKLTVLMNMDGFSPYLHACPLCIVSYLNLLNVYERFLPGYTNEIIIINAPQGYKILLETLRPILSQSTRKVLHVFDTNKRNWKPYLDTRIEPKYLPFDFGGTKLDSQ